MTGASADFDWHALPCPGCGAARLHLVEGSRLVCSRCNADFRVADTVCPECSLVNTPGAASCARCGGAISQVCPACGARSWAIAETCEQCGRALDPIAEMSSRWAHRTQARLAEIMQSAAGIKRREAAAADARHDALLEIDRRRQAQVQRDQDRRRVQEQRVMALALAGAGVLLVLVLLLVLWQAAG